MAEHAGDGFRLGGIGWLLPAVSCEDRKYAVHVSVCGTDAAGIKEAIRLIDIITNDFEVGQIIDGVVVGIKDFGAFVELAPGKEGMVHISKIAPHRINHVEDVLTLGDKVKVKYMGTDNMGRSSFSIKDV